MPLTRRPGQRTAPPAPVRAAVPEPEACTVCGAPGCSATSFVHLALAHLAAGGAACGCNPAEHDLTGPCVAAPGHLGPCLALTLQDGQPAGEPMVVMCRAEDATPHPLAGEGQAPAEDDPLGGATSPACGSPPAVPGPAPTSLTAPAGAPAVPRTGGGTRRGRARTRGATTSGGERPAPST